MHGIVLALRGLTNIYSNLLGVVAVNSRSLLAQSIEMVLPSQQLEILRKRKRRTILWCMDVESGKWLSCRALVSDNDWVTRRY